MKFKSKIQRLFFILTIKFEVELVLPTKVCPGIWMNFRDIPILKLYFYIFMSLSEKIALVRIFFKIF